MASSLDERNKSLPKHSNLLQLDPLVHCNELLWVGDRLKNLTLDSQEKHPVILPKGHHVLEMIIHIKVLETMDTNLFTCALGWFFTIRGSVMKLIHVCDRSSSFVGGKSQLQQALLEMDQTQV